MEERKKLASKQSIKADNLVHIGKDPLAHVASFFTNRDFFNTTLVSKELQGPISDSETFVKKKIKVDLNKISRLFSEPPLSQEERQNASKLWNNILKNPQYLTIADLTKLKNVIKNKQEHMLSLGVPHLVCIPVCVVSTATTIISLTLANYGVSDENQLGKHVLSGVGIVALLTTMFTGILSADAISYRQNFFKTNELFTAMLQQIADLKFQYRHVGIEEAKEGKSPQIEIITENVDEDENEDDLQPLLPRSRLADRTQLP